MSRVSIGTVTSGSQTAKGAHIEYGRPVPIVPGCFAGSHLNRL